RRRRRGAGQGAFRLASRNLWQGRAGLEARQTRPDGPAQPDKPRRAAGRQRRPSIASFRLLGPPRVVLRELSTGREADPPWTKPYSHRYPGESRDPSCATHGIELGGASPLRAARSGTASQKPAPGWNRGQLRRSDAGRGGSRRQIGEPTNRNRIQSLPLRKQGASAVGQPGDGRGRPILLL